MLRFRMSLGPTWFGGASGTWPPTAAAPPAAAPPPAPAAAALTASLAAFFLDFLDSPTAFFGRS